MLPKFQVIKNEYEAIEQQLRDTSVILDHQKLKGLNKRYSELQPIMEHIRELAALDLAQAEAEQTIKESDDADFRAMATEELKKIQAKQMQTADLLHTLTRETDPNDKRNAIIEIRAGAGGDEAALFAAELFRVYSRYAEDRGWKKNLMSSSHIGIGGLKEVIFNVEGRDVFSRLKYESGVHRVQRVPATEKAGRVHTSTVTVAVLPEAEEVDIKIDPKDLKIETMTSGGKGGQSVNTTYSAVRMTHIPTGIVVSCQDQRSQQQNREQAMIVMRTRLYALEEERLHKERSDARKGQVGTGDRSEKIRTYNFPQDRCTDHRIGLTVHNLPAIMDGKIDILIDKLREAEMLKRDEEALKKANA